MLPTQIDNQQLHVAILTDIRKLGIEAKRRQYEIPPVIIVDFESFTPGESQNYINHNH